jgi:transcriptional regulator with XRE-family HTH domain
LPQKQRKGQVQPRGGPEKAFGQALREIREAQQLSQEQLALKAGYDRTYISLVERGMRSPTIRTLVKLAAVLQVKPSSVMERMEKYT